MTSRGGVARSERPGVFGLLALVGLIRFQVVRLCRWRGSALAGGGMVLAAAFTMTARLTHRMGAADAAELLDVAFLIALSAVVRLDLGTDRERGFGEFLTPCFLTPGRLYLSRLLAVFAAVVGFASFSMPLAAAATGSIGLGVWHVALWTAVAVTLLPAVVLAELATSTRAPFVAVLLLVFMGFTALATSPLSTRILAELGLLGLKAGQFADLRPVALRAPVLAGVGAALLYPLVRWNLLDRAPPRAGRRRSRIRTDTGKTVWARGLAPADPGQDRDGSSSGDSHDSSSSTTSSSVVRPRSWT